MKTFSQFRKEANEAIKRVGVSTSFLKRPVKKKMKAGVDRDVSDVDSVSDSSQSDNPDNLIMVGGIADFHEAIEPIVDLTNRLYPIPESKLMEDTESTFYVYQVNPFRILRRGVKGYESAKTIASQMRKQHRLRFDEVKFKKERKQSTASSVKRGRIETSKRYNPSKRGYFKGVSYADGSYADLD